MNKMNLTVKLNAVKKDTYSQRTDSRDEHEKTPREMLLSHDVT